MLDPRRWKEDCPLCGFFREMAGPTAASAFLKQVFWSWSGTEPEDGGTTFLMIQPNDMDDHMLPAFTYVAESMEDVSHLCPRPVLPPLIRGMRVTGAEGQEWRPPCTPVGRVCLRSTGRAGHARVVNTGSLRSPQMYIFPRPGRHHPAVGADAAVLLSSGRSCWYSRYGPRQFVPTCRSFPCASVLPLGGNITCEEYVRLG